MLSGCSVFLLSSTALSPNRSYKSRCVVSVSTSLMSVNCMNSSFAFGLRLRSGCFNFDILHHHSRAAQ
eukprot:m.287053 g.287053  ORF g.287053 m.287053 type:complete len:68 (+) comp55008_c0_seq1:602-805(+)